MRRIFLAITVLSSFFAAPSAAIASDRADIIALVQAFNAAGNKGDRAAWAAYCTGDAEVVDHETPYVFRGPNACATEWDALAPWAAKNRISFENFRQTFAAPTFIDIDGDRAYAVFPGRAWFTQNGRRRLERLYATFVLQRRGPTWRIAQVTWTSLGWGPAARRR